jgi:hypothetical protein
MKKEFHGIVQYHLEIYEPGSSDVLTVFKAEKPFWSIHAGDLINLGGKLLKVVSVEHMIWDVEDSHIGHKLCVFTEEVEDTENTRLGRS